MDPSSSMSSKKFNILQQVSDAIKTSSISAASEQDQKAISAPRTSPLEVITKVVRRDLDISVDASIASRFATSLSPSASASSLSSSSCSRMDSNDNEGSGGINGGDTNDYALADLLANDLDAIRANVEFTGSEKQIEVLREMLRSV